MCCLRPVLLTAGVLSVLCGVLPVCLLLPIRLDNVIEQWDSKASKARVLIDAVPQFKVCVCVLWGWVGVGVGVGGTT